MTPDQSTPTLSGIAEWAVGLMESLGGIGAGLAIAIENLFPPLPSEVILPLAGFTASQGEFGLFDALFWTTLGSVTGALLLYSIGAALGRERMRRIAIRLPLVKVEDLDRSETWFERHGTKAVFLGRMVPIFRSLISVPAGIERMPLPRFALWTVAGSLIWNTIFVMAGYLLGENWHVVERYSEIFQWVVIAVVVALVLVFIVFRLRSRRSSSEMSRQRHDE